MGARGYKSASIQQQLYISEGTAKTHIRHIYRKLNVHNQQELILLIDGACGERHRCQVRRIGGGTLRGGCSGRRRHRCAAVAAVAGGRW